MSQGLTRRGFARAAGAGVAAACLPSATFLLSSVASPWHHVARARASATPPVVLVPRFELAPGALELRLFLRSSSGAAVEVVAHALDVTAELRIGGTPRSVTLASLGRAHQRRSRAGWRLSRQLVVGAEGDVLYDTFTGTWPDLASPRRTGTLTLQTVLRRELEAASHEDRQRLASLAGVRVELPVTLPG